MGNRHLKYIQLLSLVFMLILIKKFGGFKGGGEYNNNYDDGKLGAILCACLIMAIKSDVKKTVIVYS